MQSTLFDLDLSSGKTYREFSARLTTHLGASWRALSAAKSPSFLSKDGQTRAWSMDPSGDARGVFWMPNTTAWPNDAAVCSLSQVLETDPIPQKYFLSGKACAGILRRAAKRGKELPPALMTALRAVSVQETVRPLEINSSTKERSFPSHPSPCASMPTAGGGRLDAESETLITHSRRADGFDASEDGTGRGTQLVPVAFSCKDHGADAGDVAPTLRSMGHEGSHANGGGRVAVAIQAGALRENPNSGPDGVGVQEAIAYTIEARAEVQAVAFQESQTGCREYDAAGTPRSNGPGHDPVGTRVRHGMAVRRLTPRECERLQGFPDDYTGIPGMADGPRYKALGNSMAVPCMAWIGRRIQQFSK